jgi:hypothetical protein
MDYQDDVIAKVVPNRQKNQVEEQLQKSKRKGIQLHKKWKSTII